MEGLVLSTACNSRQFSPKEYGDPCARLCVLANLHIEAMRNNPFLAVRPRQIALFALSLLIGFAVLQPVSTVAKALSSSSPRATRLKPQEQDQASKIETPIENTQEAYGKPDQLDPQRTAILLDLYKQMLAGVPFAEEEVIILNHFIGELGVTELEADVVISRAIYDRFISNKPLTKEQHDLFEQYTAATAERLRGLADAKSQIVARDRASEAANPREPQVAPANDTCLGAEVIPGAGPFPYLTAVTADITDATTVGDPPTPSCQSNISRSIWYTFTPTASASYTLSTCADAPTGSTVDDTVLAVYTSSGGCAGPFTQVTGGCDDDSCTTENFQSVLTLALTGGTQYFLVVWKFDTPAPTAGNTAVQLRISQLVAPANDTCAGAIPLTLNIPVQGTINSVTVNNYQLAAASPCYTGVGQSANILAGRDVVYTFTAPSAGMYSFRVWSWSGSTNPGIYTAATCPVGAPPQTVTCTAASNRNTTTTQAGEEITCQTLSLGQTVFLFVDEVTTGSAATVTFFAEVLPCVPEAEANGTPATANTYQCGIQGGTTPASDVDFYSIGTPASGARIFAMADAAPGNSSDVDVRVTTTTDTLEYDDAGNVNTFGSLAPNVAGTRATGVQTFLRMNHFSGTNSEPYRLFSVVQAPGAGAFGSSADNEAEPNGSLATATVSPSNYFYGTVTASPLDNDFYAFSANAGDTIFVSLDGDPSRVTGTPASSSPLDAILALFNPAGTQIIGVDDTGNTTSTVSGAGSLTATTPNAPSEALVFHAQTTGIYYVGVGAFTGTGDYLLSISKNCGVGGGLTPQITINDVTMNEGNAGTTNFNFTVTLDHPSAQTVMVNYATADGSALQPGDYASTSGTLTFNPGVLTQTVTVGVVGDITNEPDENFFVNLTTPVNATIADNQGVGNIINDDNCTVTCPANITQSNDANQCGAVVTYPAPTTTGVCGTITCSPASGSFFPKGTTTVTCTSTAGPSCSFTITINDTQPPSITCPANVVQGNDVNQCGAVVNYAAPVVSDNCPGVGAPVCSPTAGSFFPTGVTTVTCNVSDAASNTASCSFTVTINDTQAPSITCPANITTGANTTQGTTVGALVSYGAPAVSDNCPGVGAPNCVPASGSFFPTGVTTVTCSVADAAANTAMCSFTITVTSAYNACYVDDGTGNTISIVTDPTNPLYGYWQLKIVATNTILSGYAEYVSNVLGRSLIAYDHDSPQVRMDLNVNYASHTATAAVKYLPTNTTYTIRDRNILNDPTCQ